ncbi:MAG: hypothetical protein ACRDTH_29050 [Pseudonocardiaceae bacterium]
MSMKLGMLPTPPFNAVHEAIRLLDSPSEPWSIQLELRVSGWLDESRLRAALGEALAHHPMTRARQLPASARSPVPLGKSRRSPIGTRCGSSRVPTMTCSLRSSTWLSRAGTLTTELPPAASPSSCR